MGQGRGGALAGHESPGHRLGDEDSARRDRRRKRLATGLERALHLAARVALREIAALVDPLLAPGDRELDLDLAVLEVEPRRDEREPLLAHHAVQRVDLAAVEEQLPVALGPVVELVPLRVLGDRRADEPRLAVADLAVGLSELRAAGAERLHLRAGQLDARLDPLEQVVVVPRAPVLGDELRPRHGADCRDERGADYVAARASIRRRASSRSMWSAKLGSVSTSARKSSRGIERQRTGVVARTRAIRVPSSTRSASSPKKSPGPSSSRPERSSTVTVPSWITNIPDPGSPGTAMTCPFLASSSAAHAATRSRPASLTSASGGNARSWSTFTAWSISRAAPRARAAVAEREPRRARPAARAAPADLAVAHLDGEALDHALGRRLLERSGALDGHAAEARVQQREPAQDRRHAAGFLRVLERRVPQPRGVEEELQELPLLAVAGDGEREHAEELRAVRVDRGVDETPRVVEVETPSAAAQMPLDDGQPP